MPASPYSSISGLDPRFMAPSSESDTQAQLPSSLEIWVWASRGLASKFLCFPFVPYRWWQWLSVLSHVWLFATQRPAAHQASLSFITSQSLLKLKAIESVMPSNHLVLCRPLLLLPSMFPSTKVFSNDLALSIRRPKYWSFSFSISLVVVAASWSCLFQDT